MKAVSASRRARRAGAASRAIAGRAPRARARPRGAHAERVSEPAEEAVAFEALTLDAAVVVAAYGLILPRAILEAPRLGCLNAACLRCCRVGGASTPSSARSWRATRRRHHHHADGRRARHRHDAAVAPRADQTRCHGWHAPARTGRALRRASDRGARRPRGRKMSPRRRTRDGELRGKAHDRPDEQLGRPTLPWRWNTSFARSARSRARTFCSRPSASRCSGRRRSNARTTTRRRAACWTTACSSPASTAARFDRDAPAAAGAQGVELDEFLRGCAVPRGTQLECPASS